MIRFLTSLFSSRKPEPKRQEGLRGYLKSTAFHPWEKYTVTPVIAERAVLKREGGLVLCVSIPGYFGPQPPLEIPPADFILDPRGLPQPSFLMEEPHPEHRSILRDFPRAADNSRSLLAPPPEVEQ